MTFENTMIKNDVREYFDSENKTINKATTKPPQGKKNLLSPLTFRCQNNQSNNVLIGMLYS